jgi:hypothetical protein
LGGQAAECPVQLAGSSQAPVADRQTTAESTNGLAGHPNDAPSQSASRRHGSLIGSAALQTVPVGKAALAGQASDLPSQTLSDAQGPAAGRQNVPAACGAKPQIPSARQTAVAWQVPDFGARHSAAVRHSRHPRPSPVSVLPAGQVQAPSTGGRPDALQTQTPRRLVWPDGQTAATVPIVVIPAASAPNPARKPRRLRLPASERAIASKRESSMVASHTRASRLPPPCGTRCWVAGLA